MEGSKFTIRKKVLSLMGAEFSVMDEQDNVVLYAKQKAFKFKEDVRLYTSKDMTEEVITIHARNIIDISATYDILDAKSGKSLGAVRRDGIKSMLKDEWKILGKGDVEVGVIKEDRKLMAFLRRVVTNLIPQNMHFYMNGKEVAVFKQYFNPLVFKADMEFMDSGLDKRVGLAAAVMLALIEGRQK